MIRDISGVYDTRLAYWEYWTTVFVIVRAPTVGLVEVLPNLALWGPEGSLC